MVNDPNLFDNNLASFPEETTGFEGGPSFLDSLDTNEPEAAELPDATPLDPRMTQYELEPPGSQGTDPFDASATGWPIEHMPNPTSASGRPGARTVAGAATQPPQAATLRIRATTATALV